MNFVAAAYSQKIGGFGWGSFVMGRASTKQKILSSYVGSSSYQKRVCLSAIQLNCS